jgi:hypothetical protein
VFAWHGTCLWLLARWAAVSARVSARVAIVLGLGVLIRPGLGLFSVAFLVVAHVGSTGWCNRLRILAWAVALHVLYQMFFMGKYGVLAPNPRPQRRHRARDEMPAGIISAARSTRTGCGSRCSFSPWVFYVPLSRPSGATVAHGSCWSSGRLSSRRSCTSCTSSRRRRLHARTIASDGLFAFAAPVAVIPARREYAAALVLVP